MSLTHGLYEEALLGIAGDNCWTGIAAFEYRLPGIELQPAGTGVCMASETALDQQWSNVCLEKFDGLRGSFLRCRILGCRQTETNDYARKPAPSRTREQSAEPRYDPRMTAQVSEQPLTADCPLWQHSFRIV